MLVNEDENKIEYEFQGEEVKDNITKRIVYKNGSIKEFKQMDTGGGYWINRKATSSRFNIPLSCPQCRGLMGWFDENVYVDHGMCEKCYRRKLKNAES
jgi:hypothetical protein